MLFLSLRRVVPTLTLLALLTFIVTSPARAGDFYIDSQQGCDEQDGRTPQTAWRTLARINQDGAIAPGDTVRLRRGLEYRGGLVPVSGEPNKPVTYSAYGEGHAPIILQSLNLNRQEDWQEVGGNLWVTREAKTTVLGEAPDFLAGNWSIYCEQGASAQYRSTEQNDSTRFEIDVEQGQGQGNHIQWINNPFSITRGQTYRLSFNASSSIPCKPNVKLMKSGAPWTSYGNIVLEELELDETLRRHEVIIQAETTAQDARLTFYLGAMPSGAKMVFEDFKAESIDVDALQFGPDVGNIILDHSRAAFKRWTREELTAQDDFWYERKTGRVWYYSQENPGKRYASVEAAIMRHIVNISGAHDVIFTDLALRYGAAHGFGGSNVERVVIRNCDISWIGGGDQYAEGGEDRRVRFGNGVEFWAQAHACIVEFCHIWEVYDAALTNQGSGENQQIDITYRNNFIWNCEYSFEYWNRDEKSRTEKIRFIDNVCLRAGYGWGHEQRPDKNGRCIMFYKNTAQTTDFVVNGNIFVDATESVIRHDSRWTPEQVKLDLNHYWQSNQEIPLAVFGSDNNLVIYQKDFNRFTWNLLWDGKMHCEFRGRVLKRNADEMIQKEMKNRAY
ncbi:MAG: carbohydrate binding domain-containing protein [Planctomycetia bacterium]|nr:carbohydrate binding domain-containing protein [Planctomycetia bacterium]